MRGSLRSLRRLEQQFAGVHVHGVWQAILRGNATNQGVELEVDRVLRVRAPLPKSRSADADEDHATTNSASDEGASNSDKDEASSALSVDTDVDSCPSEVAVQPDDIVCDGGLVDGHIFGS